MFKQFQWNDAKIYCHVKNLTDKDNLQRGIENL